MDDSDLEVSVSAGAELLVEALMSEADALIAQAQADRRWATDGLPYALAGLMTVSGSVHELGGYRELTERELQLGSALFRTAVAAVARWLVRERPEVAEQALSHPWVRSKSESGPLFRLPESERAVKAVRLLLADSKTFIGWQREGRLDADDGGAQAAMAVVYGWRKVVSTRRGIFESATWAHRQSAVVRELALDAHPGHLLLRLVQARWMLAWRWLSPAQRGEVIGPITELAAPATAPLAEPARLFATSSLVDVGLRFRQPGLVNTALDWLHELLAPGQPEHPRLTAHRAWAEALAGDPNRARRLAVTTQAQSISETGRDQGILVLAMLDRLEGTSNRM
jgi:hypothetical protein